MPLQWIAENGGGYEVLIWVIAAVIYAAAQLFGRKQKAGQSQAAQRQRETEQSARRPADSGQRTAAPQRPAGKLATELQEFFEKLSASKEPVDDREASRSVTPPPPPRQRATPQPRPVRTAMESKELKSSRASAIRPSMAEKIRPGRQRLGSILDGIKDADESVDFDYDRPAPDFSRGRGMHAAMRDIHLPRVKIPFTHGSALRMPQPPRQISAVANSVHDRGTTRKFVIGRAILGPPKGLEGFPEVEEASLR